MVWFIPYDSYHMQLMICLKVIFRLMIVMNSNNPSGPSPATNLSKLKSTT